MFIKDFLKTARDYFRYQDVLKKIYKEENFVENLRNCLGLEFRKDWTGRLYTVVNPFIDENGKYNPNAMIFDYEDGKVTLDMYIEKTMMDKLNIAREFIINQNVFDLLTFDITKLDNYGNFLFVLEPVPHANFWKGVKSIVKITGILTILIVIGLITYNIIVQ